MLFRCRPDPQDPSSPIHPQRDGDTDHSPCPRCRPSADWAAARPGAFTAGAEPFRKLPARPSASDFEHSARIRDGMIGCLMVRGLTQRETGLRVGRCHSTVRRVWSEIESACRAGKTARPTREEPTMTLTAEDFIERPDPPATDRNGASHPRRLSHHLSLRRPDHGSLNTISRSPSSTSLGRRVRTLPLHWRVISVLISP